MGLNLLLIVICLLVLMATGTWLSITLFGTGILALTFLGKGGMAYVLESVLFNSVASYSLVAIPLFVLMGEILIESGCSKQIFRGVKKLLRPFPGGMLHANIVACSIFAACSGVEIPKPTAHGTEEFSLTSFTREEISVRISLRTPVTPRLDTICGRALMETGAAASIFWQVLTRA